MLPLLPSAGNPTSAFSIDKISGPIAPMDGNTGGWRGAGGGAKTQSILGEAVCFLGGGRGEEKEEGGGGRRRRMRRERWEKRMRNGGGGVIPPRGVRANGVLWVRCHQCTSLPIAPHS